MRRSPLFPLAVLALGGGCAMGGADASVATPACMDAVDGLLEDGMHLDTLEGQRRADEIRALCGRDLASDTGFSVADTKSDGEGTGTWVESRWMERGRQCYAARDLECLESNFRFLVWVWRHYEGYDHAARAMEKFIECDTREMPLTDDEYFSSASGGAQFEASASTPSQLAPRTTEDLRARLLAGRLALDAEIALEPLLVVSADEDIRYTVGRTLVARTARYTRTSEAGVHFEARFRFRDDYDFHPDRRDFHSGGRAYAETFPYHSWAALLVAEGRACPFVVSGDYTRSLIVRP
jgi:hypothetical protein